MHFFFNFCAVLTIVHMYQIIEIIFFLLFLTTLFIFYPVALTLFFSSEIMMRLFIFKNIPPSLGIQCIY